jgi:hypothetical protein
MTPQRQTKESRRAVAFIRLRRLRTSGHERFTRDVAVMAPRHPERCTSRSSRREREILTGFSRTLWPARDYITIVDEELGGRA